MLNLIRKKRFVGPILAGLVLTGLVVSSIAQGQNRQFDDPGVQQPKIWLPRKYSDSLSSDLDSIIAHAATRKACMTVLEAKYSDSSAQDNPKFIITCASEQYGTQNLVYWQSDVREDFAGVSYQAALHSRVLQQAAGQVIVRDDGIDPERRSAMIVQCKGKLKQYLNDNLPEIENRRIQLHQRSENQVAIFMDYQTGSGSYAIYYTATCLALGESDMQLSVFAR